MPKPGLAYLYEKSGGHRPFINHREIRRGKNKDCVEVQIRQTSQTGSGWGMKTVKRIVTKDQIKRYPE